MVVKFEFPPGIAIASGLSETVGMSDRTFQFFEKMEQGEPIKGRCSLCDRVFVGAPHPGERADDVLLRMRSDFDAHDCHEETRQIVTRIVREARDHK